MKWNGMEKSPANRGAANLLEISPLRLTAPVEMTIIIQLIFLSA